MTTETTDVRATMTFETAIVCDGVRIDISLGAALDAAVRQSAVSAVAKVNARLSLWHDGNVRRAEMRAMGVEPSGRHATAAEIAVALRDDLRHLIRRGLATVTLA